MASLPQLGVPLGLLLGTGVVSLVAGPGFLEWGWRVPFLLSAVLIVVGLWVRLSVLESPAFSKVIEQKAISTMPVVDVLKKQWADVLKAMFVRTAEQAPFYIFTSFVLVYTTNTLKLQRSDVLLYVMIAAALGLITVPLAGHLSDRFGRRLVYGVGTVLTGAFAFPYFALLDTRIGIVVALAIVISLFFHDILYGPQAALISESFGTEVRYSGAGLGYQLASVTAGGPAPLIAAAILAGTGSTTGISWYIIACAVVTLIALSLMRPRSAEADARFDQASENVPAGTPKDVNPPG
jgi:MFS family permease